VKTWILPPGAPVPAVDRRQEGALTLEFPVVTPELASSVSLALVSARTALCAVKADRILRAIEDTIKEWSSPDCPARREAEGAFRAMTGLPGVSAPFGVPLEAYAHGAVREWARAGVDPFEALDGFTAVSGGPAVRLVGPLSAVFILPGNIPLIWMSSLFACLLGRTPCLLKPGEEDPVTPGAFVSSLVRHAPELGPALAVLPWKGGDEEVEREVMRAGGVVVAWGGGEAVSSLARRIPAGMELVAHGPAMAVGVVAKEAMNPGRLAGTASEAGRDALLFDGRGCLSLSTVFVERGGLYEVREAASEIAKAFARVAGELPPGRPTIEGASLVQSWRGRARARELAGKDALLFGSVGTLDWTVICDGELPMPPVPLWRTLWIHPVDSIDEIPGKISTLRNTGPEGDWVIHAMAFAGPESRRQKLAEELSILGLSRVCAFGKLQSPPVSWTSSGISPLRRLLRWTIIEK